MSYSQEEVIAKIKELNFPIGSYIAVGGSVLAVRGIRETRDLDIVVTLELFEKLSSDGWEPNLEYQKKWNRRCLKKGDVEVYPDLFLEKRNKFLDVKELIANADLIYGIPFQKLDHLIMCKFDTRRGKDLKDVELIKKYIKVL